MKPLWTGLVMVAILCGCSPEAIERDLGVRLPSPSGRYILGASESGRPGGLSSITLWLHTSDEKVQHDMRTRVPASGQWAVGWAPNEDVVVLYSEQGTTVYVVSKAGELQTMEMPQPKYGLIGQQLRGAKYRLPTNGIADGPANRSQPFTSETNTTSSAAGSRH